MDWTQLRPAKCAAAHGEHVHSRVPSGEGSANSCRGYGELALGGASVPAISDESTLKRLRRLKARISLDSMLAYASERIGWSRRAARAQPRWSCIMIVRRPS